jgi:hypothetical protein
MQERNPPGGGVWRTLAFNKYFTTILEWNLAATPPCRACFLLESIERRRGLILLRLFPLLNSRGKIRLSRPSSTGE